jgi:hypothetical protein
MRLSLNLDITEDLQDHDFSVDTPKACQRSRRVSGALPSLTPCPVISTPGWWHRTVGNTRSDHGCGHVCVGPRTVNSINFQSRICVPMPLTLSMGSKLGVYAAPAEISARPDGGLPGPTPFAPQTALALPRWLHSEYPPSPVNIIYPGARASNIYRPVLTAEITIATKLI